MSKKQLKALFAVVFLLAPFSGFAKFPGILSRFQVGYSFLSNKAEYLSSQSMFGPGIAFDTSYAPLNMKTSASWGFTAGTYFPLKRMGNVSALALSVDYMYNLMTWKSDVPMAGVGSFAFDGATVQMALPVGLDFKFGADAVQLRTARFCGTVGAGVYPSYAATTLTGTTFTIDPVFSVAPYVKAEVGIYAGICMKVRALYAIGDLTYMDYSDSDNSGGIEANVTSKLVGKSNFALSLIVMPFSFKWSEENWWNTY